MKVHAQVGGADEYTVDLAGFQGREHLLDVALAMSLPLDELQSKVATGVARVDEPTDGSWIDDPAFLDRQVVSKRLKRSR